jgi:hypothetical protein
MWVTRISTQDKEKTEEQQRTFHPGDGRTRREEHDNQFVRARKETKLRKMTQFFCNLKLKGNRNNATKGC